MIVRAFRGSEPVFGDRVFVAETAVVIGDVEIGARTSIWYGVVIRGDVFPICIGSECSIQDNTVIHVTTDRHATTIGNRVTVGHRVLLHGCTIADECLIGMGAIVMDGAVVGPRAMVGAGALVTPGTEVPAGHLALGSPARVVRELRGGEIEHIQRSADHYVDLAATYIAERSPNSLG